jgi:hypothetical protein
MARSWIKMEHIASYKKGQEASKVDAMVATVGASKTSFMSGYKYCLLKASLTNVFLIYSGNMDDAYRRSNFNDITDESSKRHITDYAWVLGHQAGHLEATTTSYPMGFDAGVSEANRGLYDKLKVAGGVLEAGSVDATSTQGYGRGLADGRAIGMAAGRLAGIAEAAQSSVADKAEIVRLTAQLAQAQSGTISQAAYDSVVLQLAAATSKYDGALQRASANYDTMYARGWDTFVGICVANGFDFVQAFFRPTRINEDGDASIF